MNASAKKPKLVRDSFTMPKAEYAGIEQVKARAMSWGKAVKKSEVLRAGLQVLCTMDSETLKAALDAVPSLKTGRPSSDAPAKQTDRDPAPKAPPSSPAKTTVKKKAAAIPVSKTAQAGKARRAAKPTALAKNAVHPAKPRRAAVAKATA